MGHALPMEPFPDELVLTPVSRKPTRLPETTTEAVLAPNRDQRTTFNRLAHDGSQSRSAVSIIVVTYNNWVFTKLCLESILAHTEYPNYEIIIVDNRSTDGTIAHLSKLMDRFSHIQVQCNALNLGFAAANNQGLATARGDVAVILNNDTVVPKGWLTGLLRHLDDPAVGLVGPVTNRAANEAQIEAPYDTYGEFTRFASEYMVSHHGESFDIPMLMMFCTAMRRDVYEQVGPLDERFEVGLFEDDDYAMRVREAGYRVICAADVFVHHFGQASFGELVADGTYGALFRANRRRFEEKWGVKWQPHRHRRNPDYQQLIDRIREVVGTTLPPDSTVIVVSMGDDELLKLDGRRAWHFPQSEYGLYAGHYPDDSADAIGHLEALRAKGGEFVLFPSMTLWWLERYIGFKQHLERRYRVIVRQEDTCVIFAPCTR